MLKWIKWIIACCCLLAISSFMQGEWVVGLLLAALAAALMLSNRRQRVPKERESESKNWAIFEDREIVECQSCGLRTLRGQRYGFGQKQVKELVESGSGGPGVGTVYSTVQKWVADYTDLRPVDCPRCRTDLRPLRTGEKLPYKPDAVVLCPDCGTSMTLRRWEGKDRERKDYGCVNCESIAVPLFM